jgi:glycosyltransferase involved in cell wall biosynthesis
MGKTSSKGKLMRILLLSRYMRMGASSRVRFYQYLPFLESQGVQVQVAPLLGDDYIQYLFSRRNIPLSMILKSYIKRIRSLLCANSFDLLWIEKELFPWLPALAEHILSGLHIPYVVDYDDAVFHRYDLHENWFVRAFLGQKIDVIMREAALVIVGNDYLGQRAQKAGAKRIEHLPSVVDQHRWLPKIPNGSGFRIGWVGSPISAPYLGSIKGPLEILCQDPSTSVVLIGAGDIDYLPGVRKEVLPWSEAQETALVRTFDVGIMPLEDGPFEQGKCGYKLIQYMACSLPVVASPVGVNSKIIANGVNGYLATSEDEWVSRLAELRSDIEARKKMGMASRKRLEERYSLDVTAPRLLKLLQSVSR